MRSSRRRGGPEREHVRRRRTSRHPEHSVIGSLLKIFFLFIVHLFYFDDLLFLLISSWSYAYALSVTPLDDYNTCVAIILRILYCVRALVLYRQSYTSNNTNNIRI